MEVINLPFAESVPQATGAEDASPSWLNMVERFSRPLIKLVLALLVFLFVIRRLIRWFGQVWGQADSWGRERTMELEHSGPEGGAALGPRQQVMYLAQKDPEDCRPHSGLVERGGGIGQCLERS